MRRMTTIVSALALLALAGPARAADKLHLERIDFSYAPSVRMFLTYVDSDGRVISGKSAADFKLIVDSVEKGPAEDAKAFETVMVAVPNGPKDSPGVPLPVDLIIVAQNSGAMGEVIEEIKRDRKS